MHITQTDVLKVVIETSLDYDSEGVSSVGYISKVLDSTPYYVKQHIKALITGGFLIPGLRKGGWNEFNYKPYPPLKGYCITEKTKSTSLYSTTKVEVERSFAEAFGCGP